MPRPYRLADARGFVLGARRKFRQRRSLVLVLERLADERSVGICELQVTDATNRRAELGYWVDPRWWGNGYASEGARRLCEVGFDTVGLNRIESGVLQGNERSQRLLGRLGFALEGVLRSRIRAGHGWLDERRFALLADEFDRPAQARVTLGVSRRMRDGGTTRPRPAGCFRRRSS
jgi:ribosomal-protein-alanine N-acetyltransferase